MPFHKIDSLTTQPIIPGFLGRMIHMETMTFSHWTVEKGAELPAHSHPHEQISLLIKGKFGFTLDGEYREVTPGMVVIIPSNAKHKGTALEDCEIVDIFSPVREDYKL